MPSRYRVFDRMAPRRAVDGDLGQLAEQIKAEVVAATPRDTGAMAAAWTVERGEFPAVRLIRNDTEYARYVEYGTQNMRADPALGRTLARYRNQGRR
jgi:hypothetical protein